MSSENLIEGTFLRVSLEDDKYYYCTDSDNYIEIGKDRIFAHYPMEDGDFNVERIKKEGEQLYYYVDRGEETYYVMSWVDKDKGIIQCALNDYEKSYYIIKSKVKTIENKTCEPEKESRVFNDSSGRFEFKIEIAQYQDEKEQKYPFAAWIIITDKNTDKRQEIYYEANFLGNLEVFPYSSFNIEDFNFDGLVDFALLWDIGEYNAPKYVYYIQNKEGQFEEVSSFPLQHSFFVERIDVEKKILTTIVPYGEAQNKVTTYQFLPNGQWEISFEFKDVEEETNHE